MALRCYTSGLQRAMVAMKKKAQQNLEHLQKELQLERNVSASLREVWVNNKKGLQKMNEMTEQLLRLQWKLHEGDDRVEELEKELEEQQALVSVITAQRDKAEEEIEVNGKQTRVAKVATREQSCDGSYGAGAGSGRFAGDCQCAG